MIRLFVLLSIFFSLLFFGRGNAAPSPTASALQLPSMNGVWKVTMVTKVTTIGESSCQPGMTEKFVEKTTMILFDELSGSLSNFYVNAFKVAGGAHQMPMLFGTRLGDRFMASYGNVYMSGSVKRKKNGDPVSFSATLTTQVFNQWPYAMIETTFKGKPFLLYPAGSGGGKG